MITVEIDTTRAAIARKNIKRAGLHDKVEIRIGKAMEVLTLIAREKKEPFDLIFIDADKEPYAEYFEFSLQLSKPGTFIIADNVIREGEVMNEKIKDSFINGVQRFNNLPLPKHLQMLLQQLFPPNSRNKTTRRHFVINCKSPNKIVLLN